MQARLHTENTHLKCKRDDDNKDRRELQQRCFYSLSLSAWILSAGKRLIKFIVALLKLFQRTIVCLRLEKEKKTKSLGGDSFSPSKEVFISASGAGSLSFQRSFDRRLMRTIFLRIWFLFPSVAEVIKGATFGWVMEGNGINCFICEEDEAPTAAVCDPFPLSYIYLLNEKFQVPLGYRFVTSFVSAQRPHLDSCTESAGFWVQGLQNLKHLLYLLQRQ